MENKNEKKTISFICPCCKGELYWRESVDENIRTSLIVYECDMCARKFVSESFVQTDASTFKNEPFEKDWSPFSRRCLTKGCKNDNILYYSKSRKIIRCVICENDYYVIDDHIPINRDVLGKNPEILSIDTEEMSNTADINSCINSKNYLDRIIVDLELGKNGSKMKGIRFDSGTSMLQWLNDVIRHKVMKIKYYENKKYLDRIVEQNTVIRKLKSRLKSEMIMGNSRLLQDRFDSHISKEYESFGRAVDIILQRYLGNDYET